MAECEAKALTARNPDIRASYADLVLQWLDVISEIGSTKSTSIGKEAVKRGASYMNARYKVKMEVRPPNDEHPETHYKITEVLDFTPAEQQINMKLKPAKKRPAKMRAARG